MASPAGPCALCHRLSGVRTPLCPLLDVCVGRTSPPVPLHAGVVLGRWRHTPAPGGRASSPHPSHGKPAKGQPSAPRGRAEDWEWSEPLEPWAPTEQGPTKEECVLPEPSPCFPGAPSTALGAAREHPELWDRGRAEQAALAMSPACASAAPALAGESEPRAGSAGLAGLSRHLLAAEKMFWTKPLKFFFFIFRILILWGNPQSVRGEQPSRCSPRRAPLLLFGCLVPPLPQSPCTDTSLLPPAPGLQMCPAGATSASLQRCFSGLPLLAASSVPSLCSAGCAR